MKKRSLRRPARPAFRVASAILALVGLLFVGVRLLTAWALRNEVNGDLAIVQLMVREMTSGGAVPAFFYGQAYMGSLEPVVNAIFHLLCGRTNFGIELGTAFFIVLMAGSVTRMARRAGGDWAAVAALLFCVVGPMPFAHYAVSPRGGYGVLLFATAGILDFGGQLICEERHACRCRARVSFVLGLLVGIGFWCNQLVFPAVAAVALCALPLAPRLLLRARFWIGASAGFASGSAPFWIWNARNDWESFKMAGSLVLDPVIAVHNLRLLASERLPSLFGPIPLSSPRISVFAVLAAFSLFILLSLRVFAPLPRRIHPDERPQPSGAKVQTALLLVFLSVFFACFALSNFAIFQTPRYLLPVVPVFAVLCGVACTSPRFRSANHLARLVLVLLCAGQVLQLSNLVSRGRKSAARMAGNEKIAAYLEAQGAEVAYCPFRRNSLNLAGTGSIAFTDSVLERVPAFRRRAETADSPVVVDDFHGIERWAVASGGSACVTNVGGLHLATDIVPPTTAVAEVALEPQAVSVNGVQGAEELLDRNFTTAWEVDGDGGTIDIALPSPRPICGVRMLVSGLGADSRIHVLGRLAPGDPFRPLAAAVPNAACRWSGPRFYPEEENPVLESRFPPVTVDAVRIFLCASVPNGDIRKVRELQLLWPADTDVAGPALATPADWHAAVGALVDRLHRQGVNRLYAGRWIANAVSEKTKGAIWTNHGQDLHPKTTGAPAPRARPAPVLLDPSSALLVSPSGVPAMRATLKQCWLKMREVSAGALGVLFIPEANQPVPDYINPDTRPLWQGHTELQFDPDCPTFLPSAAWESYVLENPPNDPDARYPGDYPPTAPYLRYMLQRPLTESTASVYRLALDALTEPTLGGDARFAKLHTWRGARILNDDVPLTAGGSVLLRQYWSSPHDALPDGSSVRVFAHFIGPDGYGFQDDYPLAVPPEGPDTTGLRDDVRFSSLTGKPFFTGNKPANSDIWCDVLWHVDRRIPIPADAPPGLYEMRVGLYDAVYFSKRLSFETRLPHRRKNVIVNPVFALVNDSEQIATP